MEWLVLFMLILIGFVLLILEFLVFPGVNVAGILGFACVGIAIYIAYSTMGTTVGHFTLLGTALCGFGVTYYVLRSKTVEAYAYTRRLIARWKVWMNPFGKEMLG